jgi:hypothetical protein
VVTIGDADFSFQAGLVSDCSQKFMILINCSTFLRLAVVLIFSRTTPIRSDVYSKSLSLKIYFKRKVSTFLPFPTS